MALVYAGYVLGLPAYRTIGIPPLLLAPPLLSRGMNALALGASVAAAGVIGFVGIVVPHLLRLMIGPNHWLLLSWSGIAGGALLIGANMIARFAVSPAELPIGIIAAAIGAPFFVWLLLR